MLWLAASVGLNVYLQVVVVRSPILGALGGGLILMTWFYLLCAGLLIGGELNAVLRARRKHRRLAALARPPRGAGAAAPVAAESAATLRAEPRREEAAARTALLRPEPR